MTSYAKIIGDRGEQLAADFLIGKNYEILSRQFRYRNGEIDIVAKTGGVLVFVEVKTADLTRTGTSAYGDPETWLDVKKQKSYENQPNIICGKTRSVRSIADLTLLPFGSMRTMKTLTTSRMHSGCSTLSCKQVLKIGVKLRQGNR